ncbi:MAG TPA: GyrI-like domain-containing protein, partial [bacterium]|nr:GyrI-like domain-containing protein [bacterium]
MSPLDYKKSQKAYYAPKADPEIITIPPMQFLMIDGKRYPGEDNADYKAAIEVLYAVSYKLKFLLKDQPPAGYTDYVVPPLEGLWWMEGEWIQENKDAWQWTMMIRQPEFISENHVKDACSVVRKKKGLSTAGIRLESYAEGLCVQMMHHGPYSTEAPNIARMHAYAQDQG